jgi:hypothetical protein
MAYKELRIGGEQRIVRLSEVAMIQCGSAPISLGGGVV